MKKAIVCILVLLTLAGCARNTPTVTTGSTSARQPVTTTTTAPPPPPEPGDPENFISPEPVMPERKALRGARSLSENGALLALDTPGAGWSGGVGRTENKLIFYYYDYLEYDTNTELYALDLARGGWIGPVVFKGAEMTVQATEEGVFVLDPWQGRLFVLNEELQTVETFDELDELPSGWWKLSADGRTVYSYDWNSKIWKLEPASGDAELAVDFGSDVMVSVKDAEGYNVKTVNADTLLYECKYYDTAQGEFISAPFGGVFDELTKMGEVWLARLGRQYIAGTAENSISFESEDTVYLAPSGRHIITCAERDYSLYDMQGEYISGISLPENSWSYMGDGAIYVPEYDGFFFTVSGDEGLGVMFWSASARQSGASLLTAEEKVCDAVSPELYERARQIGEKYGLRLKIADMCDEVFSVFKADLVLDEQRINDALDVLESALEKYPENFFPQLNYGTSRYIELQFIEHLTTTNGYGGDGSYSAFTQPMDGYTHIVFDITWLSESTVFHEFSHILDSRLEFAVGYREGAFFSEDDWDALQPPGFEWGGEYGGEWQYTRPVDYTYFTDTYATTNSTEDRARIMEYAGAGWYWTFMDNPHIRAKLDYYCRAIRADLDTEGWPEQTFWEKALGPYEDDPWGE